MEVLDIHVECLKKWRSFGNPTCPLCRDELPPGPDQLFAEACWLLYRINRRMRRAGGSWGVLTAGQQETIHEVVRLLALAAEQGHADAQYNLAYCTMMATVYTGPRTSVGVVPKAAQQGLADAQYNLGGMYDNGDGISQDHVRASEWYRKAAQQGHADAAVQLGRFSVLLLKEDSTSKALVFRRIVCELWNGGGKLRVTAGIARNAVKNAYA
eukprot:CAMPEP_0185793714 /NCGR_PEP_ID=MMETSP1174-20130828/159626_1 /TAXON_ID=35687 /ORGANISM="Dictyocha speculum, Strain CCMP1381" /LENGTH=211 /DNA_ID=CAMNT_0028488889 /DNA_START=466 /DNA_END=1101 /DNA_ORIENTATION=-